MRSMRFFVSAALMLAGVPAFCCGPFWNYPEEYYMFRAFDKNEPNLPEREANCVAWKKLTRSSVKESDIADVVYGYSLEQMKGLLQDGDSDNTFARYIASSGDKEAADFLVTAKTCEEARFEITDPWYYPSKGEPVKAALEDVIDKSLTYKGKRMEDRYVLQAVRAMFTLGRYQQLDSLWNVRKARLKEGVIRNMTLGYVAGAAYRTGDRERALEYYKSKGDLKSLYDHYSKDGSYSGLLDFAAVNLPDGREVPELLQDIVGRIESRACDSYSPSVDTAKARQYLDICLKGAENAKAPKVWYYSASFLADVSGDSATAWKLLRKAEAARGSKFVGESVKVLRMYLDAKTSKYDAAYLDRLFGQVRWLDSKICNGITGRVREITADGFDLHISLSYYYWNDMMRKVLIGVVAPKMDNVDPVLSLRLRNMADNRLLQLVDRVTTDWYGGKWHETPKSYTMARYRAATDVDNMFDYSNYYFNALDTLDLNAVIRYERSMGSDTTAFCRYLDKRGYISHDYVLEVIGTRYLRERKYQKAAEFLSQVSPSYERTTNVYDYFYRMPFRYGQVRGKVRKNYKLAFAREMAALEAKMRSKNQDIKGDALVKYGIGLMSSYDYCWALTHYHLNSDDEWRDAAYRKQALADARKYIDDGLGMIRNPEVAARNYVALYRFRSTVEKYPQTKAASDVRSSCDKLADYKVKKWIRKYRL